MPRISLRFLAVGALSLMFSFALACGGSDDNEDSNANNSSGGNPTATTSSNSDNDNSGGGTSLTDLEPDTAVVTIGGERFEFEFGSPFGDTCLTLFQVVGGTGNAKDGSDVEIDIEIPPEDYEGRRGYEDFIPEIEVKDNETRRTFRAGGDFEFLNPAPEPGESQIDSYRSDGKAATGSATFLDVQALANHEFSGDPRPEPVQGTFEIHCG